MHGIAGTGPGAGPPSGPDTDENPWLAFPRATQVHLTMYCQHTLPVCRTTCWRAAAILRPRIRPGGVTSPPFARAACWRYLAAVLDLYSRQIKGWAMAPAMPAEWVCTALQRAITARRPSPGRIVRSARGSQYASHTHRQLLPGHGLVSSLSRKGSCWDNAVMERFFLNLKDGTALAAGLRQPRRGGDRRHRLHRRLLQPR